VPVSSAWHNRNHNHSHSHSNHSNRRWAHGSGNHRCVRSNRSPSYCRDHGSPTQTDRNNHNRTSSHNHTSSRNRTSSRNHNHRCVRSSRSPSCCTDHGNPTSKVRSNHSSTGQGRPHQRSTPSTTQRCTYHSPPETKQPRQPQTERLHPQNKQQEPETLSRWQDRAISPREKTNRIKIVTDCENLRLRIDGKSG